MGSSAAQTASKTYKCTILIIGFVAYLVADSSYNISGLFYAAHLEAFPQQTGLLAIVYGLTYGAGQLMSPLIALLVRSQGERRVAVVSSLCMFAGYGLSYFAADARLLLPTFGLMVPLAAEGLYFFPMILLAYNFDRRLALASGVVASGCGAGLLMSAPVTQMLIGALTWRGAALVLGAVALNAGALALFIRPRPPLSIDLPLDEAAPEADGVEEKADKTKGNRLARAAQMLRICGPDTGLFYFAALLQTFSMVTAINFVPVMASELSVPEARIPMYPAGYGAAFTLGNLAFGYLGTRLEPFLVDTASLAASALLTGFLPAAVRCSEVLGLAVYCGMGACQGGRYALMVSLLKLAVGLQHYEICTGLYVATFFFGSFPAPFLGQWLRRRYGDYSAAFHLASGAFAAAGVATLAAWALQPRRRWRQRGLQRQSDAGAEADAGEEEYAGTVSPFIVKDVSS